ncbi:hypothetical protein F3F18_002825 [Escherichia coli]|nr:hypothetical protein [Escherichia coli]EEQ7193620.1 hypothetical protein [Escherichia coli]EEQ8114565.1 hypothetical protein [Escherichia coli]EER0981111.1 hypothetical protein [Escherichia coli]EER6091234.1 hypothetical protein [Escherichia coli]
MWRESVIKIADDMGALACSIVPAHPWVYGLGQNTDSGGYLSPANALGYLATFVKPRLPVRLMPYRRRIALPGR